MILMTFRRSSLRHALVACVSFVGCGAMLGRPLAAASYKFDMGGVDTPVAPGYLRVTPATGTNRDGVEGRHSGQEAHVVAASEDARNPNYGWKTTVEQPRGFPKVLLRDGPLNPFYADQDAADFMLYADGVLAIEESTFAFKVEPGRYEVTAVIGDLSPAEQRPGQSISANGVAVAENITTDGNVKAVTFPVQADEGLISLQFRAGGNPKYVGVMAVTAEPLAAGRDVPVRQVTHPAAAPTADTFRKNWKRWEAVYAAEWERVKAGLRADGVDFEHDAAVRARRKAGGHDSEYFPVYRSAATSWDRIDRYAKGIDIAGTCAVLKEMGIDGIVGADAVGMRELPARGIKYALYSGGQSYSYRMNPADFTPNLLKDSQGKESVIPHLLSNADPKLIAAFRTSMVEKFGGVAGRASFLFIDEPLEPYFAGGRYGDFSKPAEEAFKKWAAERGWKHLADTGFPARGRTADFYRFYQFRLEAPAMFVQDFVAGTPVERVPIVPGNGNAGEMMNHSGFWPPVFAKRGMVPMTWAYDNAASCKMYSEVTRMAEEFDARSCVTPPFGVYSYNTPESVIPLTTACISALHWKVIPFGDADSPGRQAWMRPIYHGARLTHATSGLTHTPPLYVWRPESVAFNDLVELKGDEVVHFKKLWDALFQANVDYAVTNLLKIPDDAILLYACAHPVLTEEEFARVQKFVAGGGTLLAALGRPPEHPDGRPIEGWRQLPGDRVVSVDLSAAAIARAMNPLRTARNWDTGVDAVKTYRYRRDGRVVHLLNNTSLGETARIALPSGMRDALTGATLAKGATYEIPPGLYALLEEP